MQITLKRLWTNVLRSLAIIAFLLYITGCFVVAPVMVMRADGKKYTSATADIQGDADTIYQQTLEIVKQQGFTSIETEDPDNRYFEGERNGKGASFRAMRLKRGRTRITVTMERDAENPEMNTAAQAIQRLCDRLDLTCQLADEKT